MKINVQLIKNLNLYFYVIFINKVFLIGHDTCDIQILNILQQFLDTVEAFRYGFDVELFILVRIVFCS